MLEFKINKFNKEIVSYSNMVEQLSIFLKVYFQNELLECKFRGEPVTVNNVIISPLGGKDGLIEIKFDGYDLSVELECSQENEEITWAGYYDDDNLILDAFYESLEMWFKDILDYSSDFLIMLIKEITMYHEIIITQINSKLNAMARFLGDWEYEITLFDPLYKELKFYNHNLEYRCSFDLDRRKNEYHVIYTGEDYCQQNKQNYNICFNVLKNKLGE